MKKTTLVIAATLLFCNTLFSQTAGQKKILFDCTKAETAAQADWVIDADLHNIEWNPGAIVGTSAFYDHSNPQQYPTPTQTAVTSTTTETYWEGALSSWAIDCVKKGYWVETLPYTGQITYGSTTNPQDLSNYDIYVVDEPNILFTAAEKTAIMNFVKNGGSLLAISDHDNSDRNSDNHDSPNIWNDFFTNNSVQNNAFGFSFSKQSFSQTSTNVVTSTTDSITRGPFGNVAKVQWSSGTCITINPAQNASVKAHIWKTGIAQTSDTAVLCVTSRYGCGKVASFGDSSPPEDATCDPGNATYSITTYGGYTVDASGNHRPWLMNIMIWLAQPSNCTTAGIKSITEGNELSLYPNPANEKVQVNFINDSDDNAVLSLVNINGQVVNAAQMHQKSNNQDAFVIDTTPLAAGVYYCKVQVNDKMSIKKLVVIK